MNLHSKLEKHLPREKKFHLVRHPQEEKDNFENAGFNACKSQYDEVLKRVVVDEEKMSEIIWDTIQCAIQKAGNVVNEDELIEVISELNIDNVSSKAIANSPDVIKLEGEL